MIAIFDGLAFGREAWQRAMGLPGLVLLAAAQFDYALAGTGRRPAGWHAHRCPIGLPEPYSAAWRLFDLSSIEYNVQRHMSFLVS
jgi:hypothetical protein